jgi:hypothetical protein
VLLPDIIAVPVWVNEAVKRATIGGGLLINRKTNRVSDYSRMTSSWPATVIGFLDALVSPPDRFVFKATNLPARARPRLLEGRVFHEPAVERVRRDAIHLASPGDWRTS